MFPSLINIADKSSQCHYDASVAVNVCMLIRTSETHASSCDNSGMIVYTLHVMHVLCMM